MFLRHLIGNASTGRHKKQKSNFLFYMLDNYFYYNDLFWKKQDKPFFL